MQYLSLEDGKRLCPGRCDADLSMEKERAKETERGRSRHLQSCYSKSEPWSFVEHQDLAGAAIKQSSVTDRSVSIAVVDCLQVLPMHLFQ